MRRTFAGLRWVGTEGLGCFEGMAMSVSACLSLKSLHKYCKNWHDVWHTHTLPPPPPEYLWWPDLPVTVHFVGYWQASFSMLIHWTKAVQMAQYKHTLISYIDRVSIMATASSLASSQSKNNFNNCNLAYSLWALSCDKDRADIQLY